MKFWLFFLMTLCGMVHGAAFRSVPDSVRWEVAQIEKLPAARRLLDDVAREGKVRIVSRGQNGFNAYWEGQSRTITLNTKYRRSSGSLIRSIVFELCNAAANQKIQTLWNRAARGSISKEMFVRAVEQIEYENLIRARSILQAGIAQGLFPYEASMPVAPNFETFLRGERATGHWTFLARQYDVARRRRAA